MKLLEVLNLPKHYIESKSITQNYIVANGRIATFKVISQEVYVWVITEDRVVDPVIANLVISEGKREVLLSNLLLRD